MTFLAQKGTICFVESRGVAQLGRALPWGGRGRTFKSCRSDHSYPNKNKAYSDVSLIFLPFGHTLDTLAKKDGWCLKLTTEKTTTINFAVIYDTENRTTGNEAAHNHPKALLLLRERTCRTTHCAACARFLTAA